MLRSYALVVLATLPLIGCGEKKPAAPATTSSSSADAAVARPAPVTKRPAPKRASKEARRAYQKHLVAGRELAHGQKWGEAVVEFEAALKAIPEDGRALSELGWAAFNAGDYDKARKASSDAVAATVDPNVKAQVLYNLGRVEEASAHKPEAARLYLKSLALRTNQNVAKRLAGLGKDVIAREDPESDDSFCSEPRPADKVCECLNGFMRSWDSEGADERACEFDAEGAVKGLRVAHSTMPNECGNDRHALFARVKDGWVAVATLEDVDNPCAFGIFRSWAFHSMKEETLGGHRVVKIETSTGYSDNDMGLGESETGDTTSLTLCVLGDDTAKPPTVTRCPLQVPLHSSSERVADDDPMEMDGETPVTHTPGLPLHDEVQVRVDLTPDGVAKVVLVKGDLGHARGLLGPHRLW